MFMLLLSVLKNSSHKRARITNLQNKTSKHNSCKCLSLGNGWVGVLPMVSPISHCNCTLQL